MLATTPGYILNIRVAPMLATTPGYILNIRVAPMLATTPAWLYFKYQGGSYASDHACMVIF